MKKKFQVFLLGGSKKIPLFSSLNRPAALKKIEDGLKKSPSRIYILVHPDNEKESFGNFVSNWIRDLYGDI